jgi:hypothetical protein
MTLPSKANRARVAGVVLVGLAVTVTAGVGFAHTKRGRPLLAWIGAANEGRCPFGYDVPTSPAEREGGLRAFAALHPSGVVAAARPALAFELGRDTRADVDRWVSTFGIRCKKPRTGPDLDCSDVPDGALPEAERGAPVVSAWLSFDSRDALASVTVVRRAPAVEPVVATFQRVSADLARRAGPSAKVLGEPTAAYLSQGPLYQVSAEYPFHDYYAVVRATNMQQDFALTEDYRRLAE